MSDHPHIELGSRSLPVYPQPHTRIVKRLGRVLDSLRDAVTPDGGFDAGQLVKELSLRGKLYETLVTFVPALPKHLPEHEFHGYTSPVAWAEDDYDEDNDPSPTFPQFIAAFKQIVNVNGGNDLLDMLGKVFDPAIIRAEMSLALSEWREGLTGSPSSLGTSGKSLQSSSTTTGQTPESASGSSADVPLDFAPRSEWQPTRSGEHLAATA